MCFERLLQAFARWQPCILFDIAAQPILEYRWIDSYTQLSLRTQFKVATVYSIHTQSLSWCSTGLVPNRCPLCACIVQFLGEGWFYPDYRAMHCSQARCHCRIAQCTPNNYNSECFPDKNAIQRITFSTSEYRFEPEWFVCVLFVIREWFVIESRFVTDLLLVSDSSRKLVLFVVCWIFKSIFILIIYNANHGNVAVK